MVILVMPSVSCDANTDITLTKKAMSCVAGNSANNITCQRESCHTLFQLCLPNENNGAIDGIIASLDSNAGTYDIT